MKTALQGRVTLVILLVLRLSQHAVAWIAGPLPGRLQHTTRTTTPDTTINALAIESVLRSCRSACASAVLGGLLLFPVGPGVATAANAPLAWLLPPAHATDQSILTAPSSSLSLQAATRTRTTKVSVTIQNTESSVSMLLASSQEEESNKVSVLDEAWNLINKFYIDRTFNGQDWDQVHDKYTKLLASANSNEQKQKLLTEMVQTLGDKYSRVLDQNQYAAIQKYDLIGVGVTLMPNAAKEIIVGAPPIQGSAAAKAGMRVGDFVTAVNNIPTQGRSAFDIIDQISENPTAQSISMTVRPGGIGADAAVASGHTREINMERMFQEIKNPVRYKLSETRSDGTKVGFVKILEFNSLVKPKLQEALAVLEKEGANAYVLDLRMNTGGAFQSAIEISSLFMEDVLATTVVDSSNTQLPFRTTKGKLAIDVEDPMVVWIDGLSASASEVLAGSLKDNCRAVLMGDKSFGKGLIQAVYGLDNGSGLVLTVAHYMTPRGTDIQGVGIMPDIQGHVPPPIPGMNTDTSGVDFNDIKRRLDPSMCHAPDRV